MSHRIRTFVAYNFCTPITSAQIETIRTAVKAEILDWFGAINPTLIYRLEKRT